MDVYEINKKNKEKEIANKLEIKEKLEENPEFKNKYEKAKEDIKNANLDGYETDEKSFQEKILEDRDKNQINKSENKEKEDEDREGDEEEKEMK